MNPQEADAVLFNAAGIADDSPEEQTEATTELETETEAEAVEVEESEEESTEEAEEESPESDEDADNEDAEDDDAEESEEDAEETVFEFEGEKFTANRIRDLRDKEKNLTAATTKKWQAIAEKGKALDAQLDAATQRAEFFAEQLKAPLAKFEQLDWEALRANAPEQYQANLAQYQQVQAGYKQVQEQLQGFEKAKAARAQEAQQAKVSEAVEVLQARHSDWSNDLYRKAIDHAVQQLGFPEDMAKAETNPHTISLWINDLRRSQIASKPKPKSVKRTIKAKTSKPLDPKAQKAAQLSKLRKAGRNGDDNASTEVVGNLLESLGVI